MRITRRQWLAAAAAMTVAPRLPTVFAQAEADGLSQRIAATIREFEAQGFHRTATPVDRTSGEWLAGQLKNAGLKPSLESFSISRVDPIRTVVVAGSRRIDGVPLFDAAFTTADGVHGQLGVTGAAAEVVLTEALLSDAMAATGLRVDRRVPRDRVPSGEAEAVHRRGGRYASVIGGSALFHNLEDRGPDAINPQAIARFA